MNRRERSGSTIALIARREAARRIRGKVFVIGTAVTVGLVAIYVILQLTVLNNVSPSTSSFDIGVTAEAQPLAASLVQAGTAEGDTFHIHAVSDVAAAQLEVVQNTLDALISGTPSAPVVTVKTALNGDISSALTTAVKVEALDTQLQRAGVPSGPVLHAINAANFTTEALRPLDTASLQAVVVGIALALLLFVFLSMYASVIAQGVVAEKASRVVEILLATVRPAELLLGKVLGIGAAAILQFAIIVAFALAVTLPTHVLTIPGTAIGVVIAGVAWFVLGYLVYALLLAATASLVSRVEEVNSAVVPVTLLLVLAWLLAYVVFIPEITSITSGMPIPAGLSTFATIVSLIPFFSPTLMTIRMASGIVPAWQVALAYALTAGFIVVAASLTERIYANSVLRFGARVRIRDALRRA
ncbi:MAG: ABC transporter permease [Candidatus Dormibacteraeota bacterium]|nr:ABC transporter permease [Candidatus Dormibacteraeota bacterium]